MVVRGNYTVIAELPNPLCHLLCCSCSPAECPSGNGVFSQISLSSEGSSSKGVLAGAVQAARLCEPEELTEQRSLFCGSALGYGAAAPAEGAPQSLGQGMCEVFAPWQP